MIDRDTDPSALPGCAWNADWVDRKAAQKARKCRLKDHYDRLIVSGAAIANHATFIPQKAIAGKNSRFELPPTSTTLAAPPILGERGVHAADAGSVPGPALPDLRVAQSGSASLGQVQQ
jgi:hypothetical protein